MARYKVLVAVHMCLPKQQREAASQPALMPVADGRTGSSCRMMH